MLTLPTVTWMVGFLCGPCQGYITPVTDITEQLIFKMFQVNARRSEQIEWNVDV
jgi:hypothetical protein